MLKQEPKRDWIRGRGKPESSIYTGAISGSVAVGEAKGKATGEPSSDGGWGSSLEEAQ